MHDWFNNKCRRKAEGMLKTTADFFWVAIYTPCFKNNKMLALDLTIVCLKLYNNIYY